ncbi:Protein of unknown function [Gryllus bimaculatus]|nr:Protein of unknown function [Gryllus bimaculatus]
MDASRRAKQAEAGASAVGAADQPDEEAAPADADPPSSPPSTASRHPRPPSRRFEV